MKLFLLIENLLKGLLRLTLFFIFLFAISIIIFIGYKANGPMMVPQVSDDMTFIQFMHNRLEAARAVKPARCGYGVLGFYGLTVPFYSVLYTHVGLHPDGFLAKVTARDANIPKNGQNTPWYSVPDLWWSVVERLSWSSLARPGPGCNLGPVGQSPK